jgi:hypothetical protein
LAHVGRREEDAELLDRLRRDRAPAAGAARLAAGAVEAEPIVLVRAVDLEVVEAVVGAGRALPATLRSRRLHLRCQAHEVREVAVQVGHAADQRVGDRRADALAAGTELRRLGGRAHFDRPELHRRLPELDIDARRLGEPDVHVVALPQLEADAADAHRVRAADLEALDEEVAVGASERAARVAGLPVLDLNLRALDRPAGLVGDRSGDGAGGDALGAGGARRKNDGDDRERRRQGGAANTT